MKRPSRVIVSVVEESTLQASSCPSSARVGAGLSVMALFKRPDHHGLQDFGL
jgi:hypothetical protein